MYKDINDKRGNLKAGIDVWDPGYSHLVVGKSRSFSFWRRSWLLSPLIKSRHQVIPSNLRASCVGTAGSGVRSFDRSVLDFSNFEFPSSHFGREQP